ncbi:MAG: PA2778 family cysteine peptidase [Gammaproteobacteria bacterium]|nr:PA2778 family cysteine peptidase [Gammaproteobacteria bacterium]
MALALLAGCAAGPETLRLRQETVSVELSDTPFFAQERYQCGPAALATVLVSSGVSVTPEALVSEVYIPEREGSLQSEMIAAARRHGRVPFRLDGHVESVLAELYAGRPVLVFQNLGLNRLPVWHYAVTVGHDADRGEFVMRSGTEPRHIESDKDWLARWDRGGRWTVVVVRPDELPVSASAESWLAAVAPFESLGQLDIARTAYDTASQRWPGNALVWAALGNVHYALGEQSEAAKAYARAIDIDPSASLVRNNYAQTLAELGCTERAQQELTTAAVGANPSQLTLLHSTRADIAALSTSARCPFRP